MSLKTEPMLAIPQEAVGAAQLFIKLNQIDGIPASLFSEDAPTTWTDLDVNVQAGLRVPLGGEYTYYPAFAIFEIKNQSESIQNGFAFRPNGSTIEISGASYFSRGINSSGSIIAGDTVFLGCTTDNGGIVEFKAKNALSTEIWLVAIIYKIYPLKI